MNCDFSQNVQGQCTSGSGGMKCHSSLFCLPELYFLTNSPHPSSSKPTAWYLQILSVSITTLSLYFSFTSPFCFSFIHICNNTGGSARKYNTISPLKILSISLSEEPLLAVQGKKRFKNGVTLGDNKESYSGRHVFK